MARQTTPRKADTEPVDPPPNGSATAPEETKYRRLDHEAFFTLLKGYADHAGTFVYVNRLYPEIVRQQAGMEHNYIERLQFPYPTSAEGVFLKHGGGKYQLIFNDNNKAPNNRIANCFIEADWRERPPNLNVVELVNNNNNAPYIQMLQSKGEAAIDPETKRLIPVAGARDAMRVIAVNPPANPVEQTIVSKLLDHALAAKEGASPLEIVKLVAALRGEHSGMSPDLEARLDRLLSEKESAQTKLLETIATRLEKLNEAPATPAAPVKTPVEVFTEVLDQYAKLKEHLEPAAVVTAASPGDPWYKDLATGFIQAATPALQTLGAHFTNKLLTRIADQPEDIGTTEPARRPLPPHGFAQPLEIEAPAPAARRVQTTAQPDPDRPRPPGDGPLRNLVAKVHYCLDREYPGSSLAIYLEVTFNNRSQYYQLCGLGKDTLIGQMKLVTDIWPSIDAYGPARLNTFIDEFLTAFDPEPPAGE